METEITDSEFQKAVKDFVDASPHNARILADDLLVSRPTVERWARGVNLPSVIMRSAIIECINGLKK